jgi:hypothetical protein
MIGPRFPELLAAAQGGDEQAFAVLWRNLQPAVLRYFLVVAKEAAEDLAADTWMAVIGGLGRFRGEERALRGLGVHPGPPPSHRLAPPSRTPANRVGSGCGAERVAGTG